MLDVKYMTWGLERVKKMTRQQAINSNHRQELHHVSLRDGENNPVRCRVNGKCKVWKTRPDDFRLPVKHGFKACFYIELGNADDWEMSEELARRQNRRNRNLKAA